MNVIPFRCLRPAPELAAQVAALPYDVFDRAQAARAVAGAPLSFLNIDRPETQFAPEQDMYAPEVYAKARALLDARVTDGTFVPDDEPCYYLWRLEAGGHAQTGFVACCAVDDYLDGVIRRHESTRPEKERDRIAHIEALDAQSGPIFLAVRRSEGLAALRAQACAGAPLYDFAGPGEVRHTVWRVADPRLAAEIGRSFAGLPCAYVADGHHRAASAVKVALARRARAQTGRGLAHPYDSFLSVLFFADELAILPYHRVVADLGRDAADAPRTPERFLADLRAAGFSASAADGPVQPAANEPGTFGMALGGTWWRLAAPPLSAEEGADPVARLDAARLQARLLAPVLGIDDPRADPRASFVGGVCGLDELARRAGTGGVAFAMRAASMEELLAVADAGLLMPPKSTWFEPKLLSGLFVRPLGES